MGNSQYPGLRLLAKASRLGVTPRARRCLAPPAAAPPPRPRGATCAEEAKAVRRHVGQVERTARTWTDAHREQARRLQAEGVSWAQIAERVCGDKRYKSTVQGWLT